MFKCNSLLPRIWLKVNGVKYGKHLKLIGWPFIFRYSNSSISLGDDVNINSSFFSNLLGIWQRTIIIAKNEAKIKIGNSVGISGATIYAWDEIEIGDNTLIGANVKIVDTDFHSLDPAERMNGVIDNVPTKPVIIGKNVFVGMNSIILKGTEIGDNSVIGAGSVVSGKFDEGSVIGGNPARLIRHMDSKR